MPILPTPLLWNPHTSLEKRNTSVILVSRQHQTPHTVSVCRTIGYDYMTLCIIYCQSDTYHAYRPCPLVDFCFCFGQATCLLKRGCPYSSSSSSSKSCRLGCSNRPAYARATLSTPNISKCLMDGAIALECPLSDQSIVAIQTLSSSPCMSIIIEIDIAIIILRKGSSHDRLLSDVPLYSF